MWWPKPVCIPHWRQAAARESDHLITPSGLQKKRCQLAQTATFGSGREKFYSV